MFGRRRAKKRCSVCPPLEPYLVRGGAEHPDVGQSWLEAPCAGCNKPLRLDLSKPMAREAFIESVVRSGKVCNHKTVARVDDPALQNEEPCWCGKPRFVAKFQIDVIASCNQREV